MSNDTDDNPDSQGYLTIKTIILLLCNAKWNMFEYTYAIQHAHIPVVERDWIETCVIY